MYELKKNVKLFTSKFVGTGPSSYEKRIYRTAVSQRFRNTALINLVTSYSRGEQNKSCAGGNQNTVDDRSFMYRVYKEETNGIMDFMGF